MKAKLFLFCCVVISAFSACGDNDKPIQTTDLPEVSQKFISQYFDSLQVAYVLEDRDSYDVRFTNGVELEFDKKGEWTEVDCETFAVPQDIVLKEITDYVSKNFASNMIVKISKDRFGYEVELNNGLDLDFDKSGNFKRVDD